MLDSMRLLALPLLVLLVAVPVKAQDDFSAAQFNINLPNTWKGPVQSDESHAPLQAWYSFSNQNANSELFGAQLIIYRVANFNPIDRNNWWRGRLPYGYAGLRAVAAASEGEIAIEPARAYRTQGSGRKGVIYFTQQQGGYYAVHITQLEDSFDDDLEQLVAVVRSILFL